MAKDKKIDWDKREGQGALLDLASYATIPAAFVPALMDKGNPELYQKLLKTIKKTDPKTVINEIPGDTLWSRLQGSAAQGNKGRHVIEVPKGHAGTLAHEYGHTKLFKSSPLSTKLYGPGRMIAQGLGPAVGMILENTDSEPLAQVAAAATPLAMSPVLYHELGASYKGAKAMSKLKPGMLNKLRSLKAFNGVPTYMISAMFPALTYAINKYSGKYRKKQEKKASLEKTAYMMGYMDKEALMAPSKMNPAKVKAWMQRVTPKMLLTLFPSLVGSKKAASFQRKFDNANKVLKRVNQEAKQAYQPGVLDSLIKSPLDRAPWIKQPI